jgi:hypothetical protein
MTSGRGRSRAWRCPPGCLTAGWGWSGTGTPAQVQVQVQVEVWYWYTEQVQVQADAGTPAQVEAQVWYRCTCARPVDTTFNFLGTYCCLTVLI